MLYENEELRFTCTDPDCAQYCAKISDTKYGLVEYREYNDLFIVCFSIVDLTKHPIDEIEQYCSGYYDSLEQIVSDYGFRGALQIMAECIFEQLNPSDMVFYLEKESELEAQTFIEAWTTK